MQHIDRNLIQTSLLDRVAFLRSFIGFSKEDGETLNSAAPLVVPLAKGVVDAVYDHLFKYDYTTDPFTHRNKGFDGEIADLKDITVDSPQIAFRKKFLTIWVSKIFTASYEEEAIWTYLDKVGLMHTGNPAFKHRANKDPLIIDLLACNALIAWVSDLVTKTVLELPEETLPLVKKTAVVRAFNKCMWIQSDLFTRHYTRSDEEAAAHLAANPGLPQ
ncbi:Protoglobin-domain-containing protein [Leucosporidium creatinivorum]|uniref:Protoglobin-domain-containing protein n=1 Tax=Leucosporidium creatinivorum TaxID=106004 RepID=A0A1Y2G156_9BASI|nr:Protoglobin-domain-containing protein [Leucosporidium creatinivorum]